MRKNLRNLLDKFLTNIRQTPYHPPHTVGKAISAGERQKMKTLDLITKILVIVGGLNWGLVGIAKFDLVAAIFGAGSFLSNTVYTLVGLSAIAQAAMLAMPQPRHSTVAASH